MRSNGDAVKEQDAERDATESGDADVEVEDDGTFLVIRDSYSIFVKSSETSHGIY